MASFITVLHLLAAGIWLGGLVFTASVVTPAFKRMEWSPPERIAVRSAVGRQYSKVARVNLAILFLAALFDWMPRGWSTAALGEMALIVIVIILSELHAGYFAPRLARAAREGAAELRGKLLRVSVGVSMLNLLLSLVVMVLATWRSP